MEPRGEGRVLSFYEISRYASVMITEDVEGRLKYRVVEPPLSDEEKRILEDLRRLLEEEGVLDPRLFLESSEEAVEEFRKEVESIVKRRGIRLSAPLSDKLLYYVVRDVVGYGKIDVPYNDPFVEDISCGGVNVPVYVFHRDYGWLESNIIFSNVDELRAFIRRLVIRAGQDISAAKPIAEGPLPPKGYRVHAVLDVVARQGPTFVIRRFSEEVFTPADLVALGTISPEIAAYLWMAVEEAMSLIIIGPMASGKTTLLNAVSMLIPPGSKVVSVEETPELRLPLENWVSLVTRPSFEPGVLDVTLFELLKSSLRQRPDYIVIGEIRGEEAYTFFQAAAVGHGGLTTMHAENPEEAIRRLETPPMNIPRAMIPLVKAIISMAKIRVERGIKRKLSGVTEIVGFDPMSGTITLNKTYTWEPETDTWKYLGKSHLFEWIASRRGVSVVDIEEEHRRRAIIMKWLARRKPKLEEFREVIRRYYIDPDKVFQEAGIEVM